ncbi:transcription factor HHO3-like [Neltuma alba]|uniref:transcription factor HHO3-like n=1 Tax=Neltuma alba TaxID=207710 RepID=UPI0010A395A2|nr:transcription factor HHO3-like [Prosopis alba]
MRPHLMMGFSDYIQALESERRKIHVFSKELPLSLELVTQAIEACRLQLSGRTSSGPNLNNLNGQSECSRQTSSEGLVLEEFIPIKKRTSSDCGEDDEDEQNSLERKIAQDNKNADKSKSDWLRSVQLWNPQSPVKEDIPRKTSVLEVKKDGGAFEPFHREPSVGNTTSLTAKACSSSAPAPAPAPPVAGSKKKEDKEAHNKRKQRRCWSQELHRRFVNVLQQLGGADSATPKQIRELMKVDGLTNDEVKSHLQKFRLHTRRSSPLIQNNGDSQAAPFVLVGNFIVQPPEHAAAVATLKASEKMPTLGAPLPRIYAPVPMKGDGRQLDLGNNCCGRVRSNSEGSEVADHSNSPTSSSSTHI